MRRALLGSGEEAAACTGPRELSWASVAWSPIWNEAAPLAAQPGACGESDSLRRGPLGLMFNGLPPRQGILVPAALSTGCCAAGRAPDTAAQPPACGGSDLMEEGSQAGAGGWWHVAFCPGPFYQGAPGPPPAAEGCLTSCVCQFARHPPSSPSVHPSPNGQ